MPLKGSQFLGKLCNRIYIQKVDEKNRVEKNMHVLCIKLFSYKFLFSVCILYTRELFSYEKTRIISSHLLLTGNVRKWSTYFIDTVNTATVFGLHKMG